jgi:hypothetical protein
MVECPTSAAPRSDPPSILPPPELLPLGDSDRHISRVGAGLRQSSGGARPMAPTSEDLDCRPGAPRRARAGGARPPPQAPRRSPARVPIEGGLRATECRALRLRGVPLKRAPAEERTTPTLVRRRRGILGAASLRSSYNREQSAQAPGSGDVELPNRVRPGQPGRGPGVVGRGERTGHYAHGEAGASRDLARGPCAAAAESAVPVPRRSDRPGRRQADARDSQHAQGGHSRAPGAGRPRARERPPDRSGIDGSRVGRARHHTIHSGRTRHWGPRGGPGMGWRRQQPALFGV